MRAYRDRAAYVHPRIEMAGLELNGLVLNGGDFADMHGYADVFVQPMVSFLFTVESLDRTFAGPPSVPALRVPRIEPHLNPSWLEPTSEFMG
jgi:hypothetical protein